jgi:sugar-specific transcriptional regulator TrmB
VSTDEPHVDPREAVRRLERRLDRASEAAERLLAEAAASRKPPAAGWQTPPKEEAGVNGGDLELLTEMLRSLRDLVPTELERRLSEALHELLLALRALIDFYIERLERRPSAPVEVEDIPIA